MDASPAKPFPPLIGRLTIIAEKVSPVLARLPKTYRATLGMTVWRMLDTTIHSDFAAMNDPANHEHRVATSTAFDNFKWGLRLLESQKLVTPGWMASIGPDLAECGKMIGGLVRKTRPF